MSTISLGDSLYTILTQSQGTLFKLGELIQLSYNAFELTAQNINSSSETTFTIKYPLGVGATGSTLIGERTYEKKNYIEHYAHLANFQLPLNGIYNLVTTTEIMLGDLIRDVLLEFPKKIGQKKTILYSSIFESDSLDDVHLTVISSFINELSYKSPREFAETVSGIFSFNILEISEYHKYIEIKATRDVFIHDRGTANATYKRKADSHARVEPGQALPVNVAYFLHSYEACLKLIDILIEQFHKVWPSPTYTELKKEKKSS